MCARVLGGFGVREFHNASPYSVAHANQKNQHAFGFLGNFVLSGREKQAFFTRRKEAESRMAHDQRDVVNMNKLAGGGLPRLRDAWKGTRDGAGESNP